MTRSDPNDAALLQQIKDLVNASNATEINDENKDSTYTSPFQRTVNWTFENMKMLIGSDLPIFGDEQHPAVSLRLRDMNKPINVLTGIDCWLDNLMCIVPELAMCYHVDGMIQSYEIIKTVASLLYKMAHNLVLNSDYETRLKESSTIRTLLQHCLDMLDPEKFPEYYCAAAYMMSDLFIDDNITENKIPIDDEQNSNSNEFNDNLAYENSKESVTFACVDIKTLVQPQQHRYRKSQDVPRLSPIHGNLEGRAREALKYLIAVCFFLNNFSSNNFLLIFLSVGIAW